MAQQWQRRKGVMLCYPFEEKRLSKWEPPYLCQPKYDGERCRTVPSKNGYTLVSSEENIIYSVPHINAAVDQLLGTGLQFDGELYCHDLSLQRIHSIVSRKKGLHPNYGSIQYHIFDIRDHEGRMSQLERLSTLAKLRDRIKPPLELAPIELAHTLEQVMYLLDTFIEAGYEGIIVRHYAAPYILRRSTWVMKLKPHREDIYDIVGVKEEIDKDGIPKGRLGAVICNTEAEGITFGVGSGFTAQQREELWELGGRDLIGKRVLVKYQHTTDGGVPRFSVFKEIVE